MGRNTDTMVARIAMLRFAAILAMAVGISAVSPGARAAAAGTATGESGAIVPSKPLTPAQLDELLAPIALYPDTLLMQTLAAATQPREVMDAGNWLVRNPSLKEPQLDTEAQKVGFSPAMRALIQFPTVVDMMCRQFDWTKQLGTAFTQNQKAVLDSVQRLRAQASAAGNLKSSPQQTVATQTQDGKQIIIVEPASPQVVYVPQYNPTVVYTTTAPPPPQQSQSSGSSDVAAGLIGFTAGVILGGAIASSNSYYYPHWGGGFVMYGGRAWAPVYHPYHPVYGAAFRPAYRYAPPTAYRYNYTRANVTVNRNIVVNSNTYFNRFNGYANRRPGYAATPLTNRPAAATSTYAASSYRARTTAVGQTTLAGRSGYAGRTEYAGATATTTYRGAGTVAGGAVDRGYARSTTVTRGTVFGGAANPAADNAAAARGWRSYQGGSARVSSSRSRFRGH
jgi:hypothetical protein